MAEQTRTDGLRVAILGEAGEATEWAEALAAPSTEVLLAKDLRMLLESGVDLAVILAERGEAARIAVEMATHPEFLAATVFVTGERAHPFTGLVRALVRAKREWQEAFDAIVDPVAILDRAGHVVRANRGLARVLGRSATEVPSPHYTALLGTPTDGSPDPIAESLADGNARTGELRFSALGGTRQVTTSPLAHQAGGLRGLVVILKDITDLKEQQERFLQASRLADIGQLAGGVAHEINTPLASMALRAESLLRSAEDPRLQAIDSFKNFSRYLQAIDEDIFRCKRIIGALLEFSRSRKPELQQTDLNALAEKAAQLVGYEMKTRQISLALDLEAGLPTLLADDGQIRQAVIALLMNALAATPGGGRVALQTRRGEAGTVRLTVTDDGAGIPRENLDRILSPFFTTRSPGQGTGLGLAVCHGIVTSHGGRIDVESEPGRGTRVSLCLPAGGAPEATGSS